MNDLHHPFDDARQSRRVGPPMFNVPGVIVGFIAVLVAIHALRGLLGPRQEEWLLFSFAFIPARYAMPPELAGLQFPGLAGAEVWSFVTHMLLHGDWVHLTVNSVWMLAFGSVLARRLAAARFLLISAAAAAAGAAFNLLLHWGEFALLVGASGAISGQLAGAVRLMFAEGGSLATLNRQRFDEVRALSLFETFRTPAALMFLAVWFGITIFAGALSVGPPGEEARIAWEAHVGGFVAGLALFGLFDPGPRRPESRAGASDGESW